MKKYHSWQCIVLGTILAYLVTDDDDDAVLTFRPAKEYRAVPSLTFGTVEPAGTDR